MKIVQYISIKGSSIKLGGEEIFSSESDSFKVFAKEAYRHFKIGYPKFFKMDGLSKLGFLSAEMLLQNISLNEDVLPEEKGIVLLNRNSSLDTDEKHQESINDPSNYFPSPSVFVYTLPNIMSGEICIRNKMQGENCVLVNEHFDANFSYNYIRQLFETTALQWCIGGWVDYYRNNYEAFMFVAVKDETKINSPINDCVIFEAANLEQLFNEE